MRPGNHSLRRYLPLLALLAIVVAVALWNPPLGWIAHWGSWIMVAAACVLAWAVVTRRR